jgi:CheY-like chemotaxis protein
MAAPAGPSYPVSCRACGKPFDGLAATWCTCLSTSHTLVCPHCKKCFCSAPKAYRDDFWEKAPPELFRRRHAIRMNLPREPGAVPAQGLKRPLVLVADDDQSIRRVATMILDGMGYGVLVARDGAEAIELCRSHKPDLVLTDALMPRVDGREVCRRLKADPETSGTRVIIMTAAYVLNKYKSEAIKEFQADEYLVKPVDYNLLQALLARFLSR